MGNATIIFTDGSKGADGCGCAFYNLANKQGRGFKLDTFCSIFTAEAVAIWEALKYANDNNLKDVVIMSDSRSVLSALVSKKRTEILDRIRVEIVELTRMNTSVRLFWIKSHVGIMGNEIVDSWAKRAVDSGEYRGGKLSREDAAAFFKREILKQQWNNQWKTYAIDKATQYALIHPEIDFSPWHEDVKVSRRFYCTIARLKLGHARFPAHLYKIRILESPSCQCGEEYADLNHLFFACHLYTRNSEALWRSLIELGVTLPTNIITLLRDARTYDLLWKFVLESQIVL